MRGGKRALHICKARARLSSFCCWDSGVGKFRGKGDGPMGRGAAPRWSSHKRATAPAAVEHWRANGEWPISTGLRTALETSGAGADGDGQPAKAPSERALSAQLREPRIGWPAAGPRDSTPATVPRGRKPWMAAAEREEGDETRERPAGRADHDSGHDAEASPFSLSGSCRPRKAIALSAVLCTLSCPRPRCFSLQSLLGA